MYYIFCISAYRVAWVSDMWFAKRYEATHEKEERDRELLYLLINHDVEDKLWLCNLMPTTTFLLAAKHPHESATWQLLKPMPYREECTYNDVDEKAVWSSLWVRARVCPERRLWKTKTRLRENHSPKFRCSYHPSPDHQ